VTSRVVITGLGVVAPNGVGLDPFWSSLIEGRSAIRPVAAFDAADLPCRIAGEVRDFDPAKFIDARLKPEKRMSRATQFAIAAARMALEHGGLPLEELSKRSSVPVVLGVSSSAMDVAQQPPRPWTAFAVIPHATASGVVYALGLNAVHRTISDGCASGLDAVGAAADEIARGRAEVALTGASDSMMTHWVFECFAKLRGLSTRNDEPDKASRPFDRDRDGGLIAEGAGSVVLESLAHASARGAAVYAEILGFGTHGDPPSGAEGSGLEIAMKLALANASRMPGDIDHITAHGPSDPHMDRLEAQLIRGVFGKCASRIPVASIKGVTGNPMSVGSVHQLIAACLSLKENRVPPTANLENADPECDLDLVAGAARAMTLNTIMVNTHGFGRGNSAMVIGRV